MNLKKKKDLARKILKVGKDRIIFVEPRLEEIKEAITKQDIRDLQKEGAINIKEKKGKKKVKRKKSRSIGNIRKKVNKRKREYIDITRKLRKYIAELKKQNKITKDEAEDIRKKIRNRNFKSKENLKDYIGGLKR